MAVAGVGAAVTAALLVASPASSAGVVGVGSPAVANFFPRSSSYPDMFEVGSDHRVTYIAPVNVRSDLGGASVDGVAAAAGGFGRELVVVHGSDGAVWYKWRAGTGAFSGWLSLGGQVTARPAVAENASSALVAVRGTDGRLYERMWTARGWSAPWRAVNIHLTGAPALGLTPSGAYVIYGRGTDGRLWTSGRSAGPTGVWSAFTALPTKAGLVLTEPTVDPVGGGGVYVRGADSACWWYDPKNPAVGWQSLGFRFTDGFAAISLPTDRTKTYIFGRGLHHQLYQHIPDGSTPFWRPFPAII